jgi:hypothetical protein
MKSMVSNLISQTFNVQTIFGKVAWAIVMLVVNWAWSRVKAAPKGVKREFMKWSVFIVGVVLALTLVGQFNRNSDLGFQASVLSAGPISVVNATPTNTPTLSSFSIGAANTTALDSDGFNFQFALRIVNAGDRPSVIWNWRAYAIFPNSKEMIPVLIPTLTSVSAEAIPTVFGALRTTMDNNLVQSLVTTELASGQAVIGWMLIHVNGIKTPPWGTKFVVTFEDAFKHETRIEHTWDPPIKTGDK